MCPKLHSGNAKTQTEKLFLQHGLLPHLGAAEREKKKVLTAEGCNDMSLTLSEEGWGGGEKKRVSWVWHEKMKIISAVLSHKQ